MEIRPAEISEILKQQIAGFDADAAGEGGDGTSPSV